MPPLAGDKAVLLGDTVACLADLDIPVRFIQGNGEVAVLAVLEGRDPGPMPEQAREVVAASDPFWAHSVNEPFTTLHRAHSGFVSGWAPEPLD